MESVLTLSGGNNHEMELVTQVSVCVNVYVCVDVCACVKRACVLSFILMSIFSL